MPYLLLNRTPNQPSPSMSCLFAVIVLDDFGSVGSGGSKATSVTIPVIVRPTNHAPSVSVSAALGVSEDRLLSLAGILVADPDPRDTVTVNISVASGGLLQLSPQQLAAFERSLTLYHQQRYVLTPSAGTVLSVPISLLFTLDSK